MATDAQTTTRICRVLLGLAVLWGSIGFAGGKSWAGDDEHTRATLRGVEGVKVVIEYLKPEVERAGLTVQQLQTDVELRLRQAGIRVLTQAERHGIPGRPWLYINVNVSLRSEIPLAAYTIQVQLNQDASLTTDGSLAAVSTWSVGYIGTVGRAHLTTIREDIRERVDEFINAYLSVHPRPLGSATPASTSPRRNLVR